MKRLFALIFAGVVLASPALARESLGIYGGWGAFRDSGPVRCYAIAEPVRPRGTGAFAAIGTWPQIGRRGEVAFRLSRAAKPGTTVTLSVGDRRFSLSAKDRTARSPDQRTDAAIIAAMRDERSMRIAAVDMRGRTFADSYALSGAASAIDAAALACLQPQPRR